MNKRIAIEFMIFIELISTYVFGVNRARPRLRKKRVQAGAFCIKRYWLSNPGCTVKVV